MKLLTLICVFSVSLAYIWDIFLTLHLYDSIVVSHGTHDHYGLTSFPVMAGIFLPRSALSWIGRFYFIFYFGVTLLC